MNTDHMKLLPLKEKLALVKAHTQLVDRAFYMALGVSPRHFTNIINGKASNKHTDALHKLLGVPSDLCGFTTLRENKVPKQRFGNYTGHDSNGNNRTYLL